MLMEKKISVLMLFNNEYNRFKALLHDYAMENFELEDGSESSEDCCEDENCNDEDCNDNDEEYDDESKDESEEADDESSEVDENEYAFSFCAIKIASYTLHMLMEAYQKQVKASVDPDFEILAKWLVDQKIILSEEEVNHLGLLLTFMHETLDINGDEDLMCYTNDAERICLVATEQFIEAIQAAYSVAKELEKRKLI